MKKLSIAKGSKIGIVYRPDTQASNATALKLVTWLKDHGYKPLTGPEQKILKGAPMVKTRQDRESVAMVVVLGGDGTYLRAIRAFQGHSVPILGINLGSLGFLTPLRIENFFQVLPRILDGKYGTLQARSQMLVQLCRGESRKPIHQWQALNDVVIERGPSSQLIDLKLMIEGSLVSSVKADALILGTPTGSTAYNLAAGGPILHPESPCFVASPVAPHSLTSRPLIFPDTKELQIQLQGKCPIANLVIDGQKCEELSKGETLRITKSSQTHWMVELPEKNFYELLREKLSFGERE